jgi:hypothetical protein
MSQTKKQKREKLLLKFEKELKELEAERKLDQESVNYYIRPSARQYYVEEQVCNLKRNLGVL